MRPGPAASFCLLGVLLAGAWLVLATGADPAGVAVLAPWLAGTALLLSGRRPGEERLARLRARRPAGRRRPPAAPSQLPARARRPRISGGLLLARSLAVRPPPAACAARA